MQETFKARYIDPMIDWSFKRLFGSEVNKDILIEFLKVIFPEFDIKDIHIRRDSKLSAQTSTSWTLCARPCMKSANHAAPWACALGISL